ncbi:MAG: hypothetical protein P1V34_11870 [Alphaproteobacteria bacterium]|nr:hypothetical protein [Alphaproteobacteria bacterium]
MWRTKLSGAFGQNDLVFGGHPLDEDRAKLCVRDAKKSGDTLSDFENEMRKYMVQQNPSISLNHVIEQIDKARIWWGKKRLVTKNIKTL